MAGWNSESVTLLLLPELRKGFTSKALVLEIGMAMCPRGEDDFQVTLGIGCVMAKRGGGNYKI